MYKSLKILHVANFPLNLRGAGFFSTAYKLSNGFTRLGHNVLNFCDRDVARSATIFRTRTLGRKPANRKLIELAGRFCPDLVVFGMTDLIVPETLAEIRRKLPEARMAQWNVDPLFTPENVGKILKKTAHVECTFATTAGPQLRALGAGKHRTAWLPNPVDLSIERGRAFERSREELQADLFYAVGLSSLPRNHGGVETTAAALTAKIAARFPDLRLDFPGILGPHKSGFSYETALENTAMGLNISRKNDVCLYSSDRMAQMMGFGVLTFMDRAAGFDRFFSDDEVIFYTSEDELLDAVDLHRQDDALRRRRAEAGWSKYHRLFSVEKVASYLLKTLYDEADPDVWQWA